MTGDYRKIQLIMDLRNQGIRDQRLLEAMEKIPREDFISDVFAGQAYADQSLPIACGQTISQPYVVALMTSQLQLNSRIKVLEIGTGSGYQAAILSKLCRRVYTIERYRTLMKQAEARFKALRLANITTLFGDGNKGWPAQAPFERIIVTAAAKSPPAALLDQLAPGGIMVIPVDAGDGVQDLQRITRLDDGTSQIKSLLKVRFVPLVDGAARDL